jgi:hypothetical protein
MPDPRADGRLEIPVEPLADGRGQRRRATIAVLTLAAVVGGAIGLARLADDGPRAAASAVTASGALRAAASPGASADAVGGPRASARRWVAPRVEALLDVPDRPLTGGPRIVLEERSAGDFRLLAWTPGSGLSVVRSFRGAIDRDAPDVMPVAAPTDDRVLLLTPSPRGVRGEDRARLVDANGRVIWSSDDVTAISGAVWSADGRMVAVAGAGRRWHLVSIGVRGTATDRAVLLPFRVFLPTPLPRGWLTIPPADPPTLPLGLSADGRWVYGGVVSPELGILIASFRVAVDGRTVEPVADLGVGRADGLAPRPGTLGGQLVDPTTGRVAALRVNANASGGPPTIEIHNPDAGFVFSVGGATPLGSGWNEDGGLFVLSADSPLYADRVELVRYASDGTGGPPVLTMGPVTSAAFLGIQAGYAIIAESVTRPAQATQIILVDVVDPSRISAVRLPSDDESSIIAVELRP